MSRVDTWMPLYIGDYLADTRRLTTTEHGAYMLLLMEQWRRGWLPDDDEMLARIVGMRLDHWRKAAVAIRPYFAAGDQPGQIRQKRLHEEREKAIGISAKRADAARAKAAAPRSEGGGGHGAKSTHVTKPDFVPKPLKNGHDASANAQQMQEFCPPQLQSQLESKEEIPSFSHPSPAARVPQKDPLPEWMPLELWAAWEHHRASQPGKRWSPMIHNLSLADLTDLRSKGNDPAKVIRQALAGGYTAFRPLPREFTPQAGFKNGFAEVLHGMQQARGFIDEDDVTEPLPINRFLVGPTRAN